MCHTYRVSTDAWLESYNLADYEAILYARLSQNRDGRSRSIPQQLDGGRAWCQRNRIPIAEEIIDDDLSASRYARKKRDGYEQVLTEGLQPRGGKRRILVVWESSRAQRELGVYVRLRKICEETGALWCYDGRVYDMSNADDRRRTAEDAVRDEYESEITRKRVLRDVRDSAAAGRPHGKLAYGYRIIRDERDGHPIGREPHPEHAPIVQEIVSRILAGESVYAIGRDLDARKIPGPRTVRTGPRKGEPTLWSKSPLARMVKSPTYAALRTHRGEIVGPATWPPLITRDEHDRLVALLGQSSRLTHHGTEPKYLLPGVAARCGVCGGMMKVFRPRGTLVYTCREKFCTVRVAEPLETMVEEAVLQRLESPDGLKLMAANDADADAAYAEARALRERLDSFVDQAADGELSAAALARIEKKLKPQIAAADRRARASISSPLVAELMGPEARTLWSGLDMRDKRDVVASLCVVTVDRMPVKGMRWDPRWIRLDWVGDEPSAAPPAEPVPLSEMGDPGEFTAPQVLSYLRSGVDFDERVRVVEAERAGLGRSAIMRLSTDPKLARPGRK